MKKSPGRKERRKQAKASRKKEVSQKRKVRKPKYGGVK